MNTSNEGILTEETRKLVGYIMPVLEGAQLNEPQKQSIKKILWQFKENLNQKLIELLVETKCYHFVRKWVVKFVTKKSSTFVTIFLLQKWMIFVLRKVSVTKGDVLLMNFPSNQIYPQNLEFDTRKTLNLPVNLFKFTLKFCKRFLHNLLT